MNRALNERLSSVAEAPLDAVVFDIGNVLITYSLDELLRGVCPEDETMRAKLERCIFHMPYWTMLDRGTIEYPEAAQAMACGDSALEKAVYRLLTTYNHYKRPVTEGERALRACKAHQLPCYLLSNYHKESYAETTRKFPFLTDCTDGGVISAHVNLLKPDPAIFHLLAERYALSPERTLFIDDAPCNVECALHLGFQAICFDRPGVLNAFFAAWEQDPL